MHHQHHNYRCCCCNQPQCQHKNECNDSCLTRSELYAVCRELNNSDKHNLCVRNVNVHLFDAAFGERAQNINENLNRATLITDQCSGRSPYVHRERISRILKTNSHTIKEEYQLVGQQRYAKQKW
jgi:hypothetical protein